jgi:hypothetical protein
VDKWTVETFRTAEFGGSVAHRLSSEDGDSHSRELMGILAGFMREEANHNFSEDPSRKTGKKEVLL